MGAVAQLFARGKYADEDLTRTERASFFLKDLLLLQAQGIRRAVAWGVCRSGDFEAMAQAAGFDVDDLRHEREAKAMR